MALPHWSHAGTQTKGEMALLPCLASSHFSISLFSATGSFLRLSNVAWPPAMIYIVLVLSVNPPHRLDCSSLVVRRELCVRASFAAE